jgi:hypothetical protein
MNELLEARKLLINSRRYRSCYRADRGHYSVMVSNPRLERVIQYIDARISFERGGFFVMFNGQVAA